MAAASSWSQSLSLSTYDSASLSIDSTSLPPSSSSLATLTGDLLFGSQNSFCDTSDWTTFSSQPTNLAAFSCDDLSSFPLATGGMDLTMPSFPELVHNHDTNSSQPMEKGLSNSGSTTSASSHNQSSSPESPSNAKSTSKGSTPLSQSARIEKRKANTMAARRYRQKRVDQMNDLETQLKQTQSERDDLKVRCARLEGEVETLRQLLRTQK
ncbi:hypothetical protein K458DRAFT_492493 [Lentithecium fluviatile CBS 122367]|uniref:BZIP domain-containing protein n=1 Tax=Lentithecium fluviatile CBS 122367 TaxID=1168545 RepID=A0A6G1IEN5_9PLEO|nr:hypothetical protein K458DRAFT_492493 [Lentithecium fluviatile CBS 122367]